MAIFRCKGGGREEGIEGGVNKVRNGNCVSPIPIGFRFAIPTSITFLSSVPQLIGNQLSSDPREGNVPVAILAIDVTVL